MMKKLLLALSLAIVALIPLRTYASHALGAELTYQYVGPNTYTIVYTFYRDCSGISQPSSVTVNVQSPSGCGAAFTVDLFPGAGCATPNGTPSGSQIGGLCSNDTLLTTCYGGTLPGVQVYSYCGTLVLPSACTDWVVSYSECCRNAAINNISGASSYDLYVQTNINNANNLVNSSPFFTTDPSQIFCATHHYCYNHGAVDVDGDSLAFSLVNPLTTGGAPIGTYNGGLSPTTPMTTINNDFTFDPTTGQMCFTPDQAQVDVITVQVDEYRNINGVVTKIGTSMRDIQFNILSTASCNSQVITPPVPQNATGGSVVVGASDSIVVCPNTPLSFTVSDTSSNGTVIYMSSNSNASIPGSTFNVSGAGTTIVHGTFSWTPGIADSGLHSVIVVANDSACPFPSSTTQTIKIYVFKKPTVIASATASCGDSVQLLATGGTNFTWTPTTGLSCTNCPNPKAKPSSQTTYTAHGDCGDASVTIKIGTPFTLNAGNDTSICLNGAAQLNAIVTGGVGPFTYTWSPSAPGLISNPTILNPQVTPQVTTSFAIHAVSSEGCVRNDTIKVTLAGAAPKVVAMADPDTTCPGGTVQLNLQVLPQYCGASSGGCGSAGADYTLGTGVTQNGNTDATPVVYGNWYGSRRVQIIYRASEILAMGSLGGQINSMAFNIASFPPAGTFSAANHTYLNFEIKMKCVSDNAFTGASFISTTGMTTVFNSKTVNLNLGWNVHTFDTPYAWDGSSNIVVEICWSNNSQATYYTQNAIMQITPTAYNSIIDQRIDLVDACPLTTVSSTNNQRPDTRFNICQIGIPNGSTINWTPTAGLNNPNIINPKAQVFNNTTFSANVSFNGCVGSGLVNVVVQKNLQVIASNDTSICIPDSIQMSATTIGAAQPIQLNCGVNGTACGGANAQYTVGSASTSSNTANPYIGSDEEAHMQMIFLASELRALGMKRGVINNLAFNVVNKSSSGQFQQFTIKMGCTNLTSVSTNFQTGLATVYAPQNVTTSAGWNTYAFTNPYDWDGYSNILVEVCFTNPAFGGTIGADIVAATTTSFYSTVDTSQSFVGQGGCNILSGAVYQLRPDTRFNICPPPPGTFHYTWRKISGVGPSPLYGATVKIKATQDVSYQVEVTDSSCYAYDTMSIHFLNGYSGNLIGKNIGCNGSNTGDIIAAPTLGTAPYTFNWKNSSNQTLRTTVGQSRDTLRNLAPGQYFVFMTDANNCQSKDSITLTVPSPLKVDSLVVGNVGCFGNATGSVAAYISGGTPYNRVPAYDYLWSNNATTTSITGLTAALYGLNITDSSGCTLDTFAAVTQPAQLIHQMDSTPVLCFGGHNGTATINIVSGGSGNFSYLWSNGEASQTDTNLAIGTYVVTLTDVPGNCVYVDSIVVTQPDSFQILISAVKPASCYNSSDGQAEASVGVDTTNYTFLWDNAETTAWATHLAPGIRRVVVTNNLGCPQFAYATIAAPNRFSLSTALIDSIKCYGDSNATARVIVDNSFGGVAPFRYWWTNQQNHDTIIQLKGGETYYVTVTDANGCDEYDSLTVAQPDSLHLTGGSINATCYNGSDGGVFVTVTGGTPGYYYDWSTGAQTDSVRNLQQGTYSVTVSDKNNCRSSIFNIPVGQPATPVGLKSINVVNVSCPGNNDGGIFAVAQGGTPGYLYSLNGGVAQTNGYFNPLKPDSNYVLMITDTNHCNFDTTLVITQPDSFSVAFVPPTDTIKIGDSVLLQPTISPLPTLTDKFTWSPSVTLNCDTCPNAMAKPLVTTVYEMTLSRGDTNQCSKSARVEVVVINDKVLYVPNAFSPNDDGFNDFFQAFTVGGKSMKMSIYDRWGELMYSWDGDMTGKWDGKFNGEELPPAVYVYYIEVTYLDNQVRANKGSVTIIK